MSKTVLVGAAGQTGRSVLAALRDRQVEVTAMVRSDARRSVAVEAGAAATVVGDLEDHASLRAAFTGAQLVFVIPPVLHPREDELVENAVAAATAAGVRRFVLQSVLHPFTPTMPHHLRKARAEAAVRASRMRWTILQPAMYAQTFLLYRAKDGDGFRVPWDAGQRLSVVDREDVAEVAALVVDEDGHDFASYELAGPEALSMLTMGERFGALSGTPSPVVSSPPQDFRAPASWPLSALVDAMAMFAEYDRHGLLGNARVLRDLLGREPTTFLDAMRREVSAPRA